MKLITKKHYTHVQKYARQMGGMKYEKTKSFDDDTFTLTIDTYPRTKDEVTIASELKNTHEYFKFDITTTTFEAFEIYLQEKIELLKDC